MDVCVIRRARPTLFTAAERETPRHRAPAHLHASVEARPRGKLSRQEASVFTLRPLVERRHTRRKHHALFRVAYLAV